MTESTGFEELPPVVDNELARDPDVPKLPASAVVDATVAGLARDPEEIGVAQGKQLAFLARVAPRLADRILIRAL